MNQNNRSDGGRISEGERAGRLVRAARDNGGRWVTGRDGNDDVGEWDVDGRGMDLSVIVRILIQGHENDQQASPPGMPGGADE